MERFWQTPTDSDTFFARFVLGLRHLEQMHGLIIWVLSKETGLRRTGWLRNLDSAAHAFVRNEERLQKLSAKPSEIARRQLRVTPYPHEDTGWIIRNSSEEMCMFSTDYPHVEGGRNPLKRFGETLEGHPQAALDGFYADNFIDMMGSGLSPELRLPQHLVGG